MKETVFIPSLATPGENRLRSILALRGDAVEDPPAMRPGGTMSCLTSDIRFGFSCESGCCASGVPGSCRPNLGPTNLLRQRGCDHLRTVAGFPRHWQKIEILGSKTVIWT